MLSVSAVKWMLPFLLFLSLGGHTSFAFSIPEIEQEVSTTEETLRSGHSDMWAIRENSVPKFSDPSENNFFGSCTGKDPFSIPVPLITAGNHFSEYKRDLRKYISDLIFPTHFFF